ncbi:MAG: hypothetical protein EU530_09555 [Promethearchaeota archaeon]|nr:MAG: hypothetical protein EU530_09555 [Candidatus Lokiarchaeota archaeon]
MINTDKSSEQIPLDVEDESAKKIKFGMKIKLAIQAIKPIITSHHPLCDQYKEHSFHLFGRDWCIGCYIGYPSGILMLLIGYLTGLFQMLETSTLFITGASLMGSYILSVVGLTKIRWIKIFSKIPLGIGAAFLIAGLFSLSGPIWLSFLLSFLLIQIFLTIINVKRALEMKKTCADCEYASNHDKCPGMHPIMEKLNKIKKKMVK